MRGQDLAGLELLDQELCALPLCVLQPLHTKPVFFERFSKAEGSNLCHFGSHELNDLPGQVLVTLRSVTELAVASGSK